MADYRTFGLYTARDIAEEVGVTHAFVGKVANIFDIKGNDEYSVRVSNGGFYLYTERGREELLSLIDIITRYENGRKIHVKKR